MKKNLLMFVLAAISIAACASPTPTASPQPTCEQLAQQAGSQLTILATGPQNGVSAYRTFPVYVEAEGALITITVPQIAATAVVTDAVSPYSGFVTVPLDGDYTVQVSARRLFKPREDCPEIPQSGLASFPVRVHSAPLRLDIASVTPQQDGMLINGSVTGNFGVTTIARFDPADPFSEPMVIGHVSADGTYQVEIGWSVIGINQSVTLEAKDEDGAKGSLSVDAVWPPNRWEYHDSGGQIERVEYTEGWSIGPLEWSAAVFSGGSWWQFVAGDLANTVIPQDELLGGAGLLIGGLATIIIGVGLTLAFLKLAPILLKLALDGIARTREGGLSNYAVTVQERLLEARNAEVQNIALAAQVKRAQLIRALKAAQADGDTLAILQSVTLLAQCARGEMQKGIVTRFLAIADISSVGAFQESVHKMGDLDGAILAEILFRTSKQLVVVPDGQPQPQPQGGGND